jgi:hypothetical protein
MASFQRILGGLRKAEQETVRQLEGIRTAIASLGGATSKRRGRPAGSKTRKAGRRKMSAKARAAISAAQKARWAKQKAAARK